MGSRGRPRLLVCLAVGGACPGSWPLGPRRTGGGCRRRIGLGRRLVRGDRLCGLACRRPASGRLLAHPGPRDAHPSAALVHLDGG
eukprot:scaffold9208_cov98-Isochrysis_galbana.AAC.15